MEGDDRKIGTDRLTGPDTGKVTGRRKPALTSHRTSQGRQRKPRKENATPAEANPGQAIAQNRSEAMQVCLGLTAMSAPFAFGGGLVPLTLQFAEILVDADGQSISASTASNPWMCGCCRPD